MPEKKHKLTTHAIDEISLVPAGDNGPAVIVLSKAEPEEPTKSGDGSPRATTLVKSNEKENIVPNPVDEAALIEAIGKADPALVEYIRELETENDELIDIVTESVIEDGVTKEAPTVDDVLSKSDPAVQALVTSLNEKATEAIAKAEAAQEEARTEREARISKEYLDIAKGYTHVPGTPEDKATMLRKAFDTDESFGKNLKAQWDATQAAFSDDGAESIFKEAGASGHVTTVADSVTAQAEELRKADPSLTIEQARTLVRESNPELYTKES